MSGTLSVVATPIGNLGDITLRAIETLKSADAILCEDTRMTSKLLAHFAIKKTCTAYHEHSSEAEVRKIIGMLEEGKHLALVTDAGTPGVSDPGNKLISLMSSRAESRQSRDGVEGSLGMTTITPIPGASALTAALSVCGFPTNRVIFLGFPPQKNKRKKFFEGVANEQGTVVLYESNHRIKKTLTELSTVLSKEVQMCLCRELTKQFESIYRGTTSEVLAMDIPEKGEFVIVIHI